MNRRTTYIVAAAAAVLLPLALFLHTFSASPLPKPSPYTGPLPSTPPPREVAVFAVVTGVNHRLRPTGIVGARCSSGASFRWPELW